MTQIMFPTLVEPTVCAGIQERFEQFHDLNPWVYERIVQLTRDLVQRDWDKVGIAMIFEVMRWQWAMSTNDPSSPFKLNNSYRSRYARLIMDQEPDLADVFETRELKA